MKNTIILISHHYGIGEGLKEMINEMVADPEQLFEIKNASGTSSGALGTNPLFIHEAVAESLDSDNIYLLYDIGSGAISAEMAVDFLKNEEDKAKCIILKAPLVEGAYVSAVECSIGHNRTELLEEVKKLSVKEI